MSSRNENVRLNEKQRIIEIPISSTSFIFSWFVTPARCAIAFLVTFVIFLLFQFMIGANTAQMKTSRQQQHSVSPKCRTRHLSRLSTGGVGICCWALERAKTFRIKNKVSENKFQFISPYFIGMNKCTSYWQVYAFFFVCFSAVFASNDNFRRNFLNITLTWNEMTENFSVHLLRIT